MTPPTAAFPPHAVGPHRPARAAAERVLIADDQPAVREALRLLLKGEGYETVLVHSPAAAREALARGDFGLALIDLNYTRDTTSGQEGLDFLTQLGSLEGAPPVVVMTAWATIDLAVEAMRRGARDFIQKPWDNARVLAIGRTQLELGAATRRNARLEAENHFLRNDCGADVKADAALQNLLLAASLAMRPVLDVIARVGPSDANVLITGENGTGKGVVARALHAASARAAQPLITVNMGGLSEGLFESELFGHVKGAFTDAKTDRAGRFELADGGTLFLDEIGNLPLAQQAKLLRTLETGEFERVGSSKSRRADVRLLAATNADLPGEVAAGRFRRDLLYRLNTVELRLPPLRERGEDIPLLAAHFLARHAARYRKRLRGFDGDADRALRAHTWPGNVRELDHAVERAVLLAAGEQVRAGDLGLLAESGCAASGATPSLETMSLEEVERFLIQKALARHGGKANAAAESLGLSRSAFYRRLQQYGL
ncbi:MAG: sigma-54-dependent Fis family transcriptional regulator [Verrucomicrobia bacterium]|nr:sigma-54-dependent Fis family transcriptional regulator [Verrucomicrobiota bacterium]